MGTPWEVLSAVHPMPRVNPTYSSGQSLLEHGNNVLALDTFNVETLGPSLKNTLIDVVLGSGVGEGETQGKLLHVGAVAMVCFEELEETVGDVVP